MLKSRVFHGKYLETLNEFQDPKNSNNQQGKRLWWNLSSMPINTGSNLKTRFVWEKKKRIKISKMASILVQCSLRRMLEFLCNLKFSRRLCRSSFYSFYLSKQLKSLWKNWNVSWSMSVKSSTVGCLSKSCCQCALYLLRRNFEHSCDQETQLSSFSLKT